MGHSRIDFSQIRGKCPGDSFRSNFETYWLRSIVRYGEGRDLEVPNSKIDSSLKDLPSIPILRVRHFGTSPFIHEDRDSLAAGKVLDAAAMVLVAMSQQDGIDLGSDQARLVEPPGE